MGFLRGGVELASLDGYPHILISYYYDRRLDFFDKCLGYEPEHLIGDSGAFSAWTMGDEIDLEAYAEWCRIYLDRFAEFKCVSLDIIAGAREGIATRKENQRAMRESVLNGDALRAKGLPIMEVFHQGEPLRYLDKLLDRRQPGEVLGISPRDRRPASERQAFCDEVFSHLRDRDGWTALSPTHALGVGAFSAIALRYPWWSLDSSSWIAASQYGKGVTRSGSFKGSDTRTRNRSVRHLYLTRVLEGWRRQEDALTKLWADRGVSYAA